MAPEVMAGLVEQLTEQVDGTVFRTVRLHLLDPASEIDTVVVVTEGNNLAEMAALLVSVGDGHISEYGLDELALQRRVRFIVADVRKAKYPEAVIALDSIPDQRKCRVLLMPPCYIIQFV